MGESNDNGLTKTLGRWTGRDSQFPHQARHYHPSKRGENICSNDVVLRQEIVDEAVLAAVAKILDAGIVKAAVQRALDRARSGAQQELLRRDQIERELELADRRIDRLLDALAEGSAPKDEVVGRLNVEKAKKTELAAELDRLARLAALSSAQTDQLQEELRSRVADVRALLDRHTPQARQMLRKLLVDKLEIEPVADGACRGYRFKGELTIERLLSGEALELVSSWWPQREAPARLFMRWSCRSMPLLCRPERDSPVS
jgi:Arc/MetJ family transcription regulator